MVSTKMDSKLYFKIEIWYTQAQFIRCFSKKEVERMFRNQSLEWISQKGGSFDWEVEEKLVLFDVKDSRRCLVDNVNTFDLRK